MKEKQKNPGTQGGFTLIEVIVSLVLVSTVGMALLGWINVSLNALHTTKFHQTRALHLRNAHQWLQTLNPMETPTGTVKLGELRLQWSSNPIRPPQQGTATSFGYSVFKVGLYQIQLDLFWGQGQQAKVFFQQYGYQSAADEAPPL